MSAISHLREFKECRDELICSGWETPNTYSRAYSEITGRPAVYLFLVVDRLTFESAFVAYVGMSKNLKQRVTGHPVLREIQFPGHWVMTWFKPTAIEELREIEARYIREFDPPWNIVGRKRGIVLQ